MKTLAVVIGNDKYYGDDALTNAVNDAKGMAEAFQKLGYEVLPGYDCSYKEMLSIIQEFEKRLPEYEASIFYYAGHGFEVDGVNYLTSIECQIQHVHNRYDLMHNNLDLEEVLRILKKFENKVNIIIIDACRTNVQRGGVNNSFAPVLAPHGTLIAFSTSPKMGASDKGIDGHSVYTGALLKYIGRQRISVEELFKKVRITVFDLTKGRQVTWEHTSLIGDFHFNTGQMVHSLAIPYDDSVVKDSTFDLSGGFGHLIGELKSANWDRQNTAMREIWGLSHRHLDKNQQFILGRNLLQASAYAFDVQAFFRSLGDNLRAFQDGDENHVLNGILFEIYFDKSGEFRERNLKTLQFETIMALRKDTGYKTPFDFIHRVLEPHAGKLLFVPQAGGEEPIVDVNVIAESKEYEDFFGAKIKHQYIHSVKVAGEDILDSIRTYPIDGGNESELATAIANEFAILPQKIHIHSREKLQCIELRPKKRESFPEVEI